MTPKKKKPKKITKTKGNIGRIGKNPDGNPFHDRLLTLVVFPLNKMLVRLKFPNSVINRINSTAQCIGRINPAICLYTIDQIEKLLEIGGFSNDIRKTIMHHLKPYEKGDILVKL